MKFSLFFFSGKDVGQSNKYQFFLEACELADQLGLAAIWVPERHFDHFGGIFPSPTVAAAAIATRTKQVEIRAGSVVLPLHHPIRVAEEWAMIDNLSNGRVGISFASGWHAQDFILQPQNYITRREVLIKNLDIFEQLWKGEKVTFQSDGEGMPRTIQTFPRPLQTSLPCWLTAAGHPGTFELAGKRNMRLLTHLLNQTIDELQKKLSYYYDAIALHESAAPYVTLMMHTFIGESDSDVKNLVEKPLKNYLRTALNLENSQNSEEITLMEEDIQAILDFSFERYFSQSGLFGSPQSCLQQVERLQTVRVNEIACLIDFGVDEQIVLANIKNIAKLSKQINQE